jgi:hypothetical protein
MPDNPRNDAEVVKTVILSDGGTAGGLMVTASGVRSIPPFDSVVRLSLKSAAAMVNAVSSAPSGDPRRKMARLATSLCNLAVEQVEEVVGPLGADRSLIYQDDDGGFSCGSTGKPPVPVIWPPRSMPSVSEVLDAGVIELDLVELVQKAHNAKIPLTDLYENPEEIAKKVDVTISEKSAKCLRLLAPSKLDDIKNPVDREIVEFFHKVTDDGRFVDTWFTQPYEVSQKLKCRLSDAAIERLVGGELAAAMVKRPSDVDPGTVVVVIFVAVGAIAVIAAGIIILGIVLALSGANPVKLEDVVKDRSGRTKI